MRVFYFLYFSLAMSFFTLAQGNLPFEYMGIEHDGIIYEDGDTLTICGSNDDQQFAFNAEYLPIGLGGSEYEVQSIPYTTIYPTSANELGNGVDITSDDFFSPVVDLPFEFCFFGQTYTQLVVGANGRIVFDPSLAESYDSWGLDLDQQIPTPEFEGPSIFGVYQDININDNSATDASEFNYGIYGEAPFRAFVVNYKEIPLFGSCDSFGGQNYQIILHEGTMAIDVIIHNRNSCLAWNDGLGVLGIQNVDGTIGYVPPERNMGTWDASMEAWRFLPSAGGLGSANTITWYVNDEYAGPDTTLVTNLTETYNTVTLRNNYYMSCVNDIAVARINLVVKYVDINLEEESPVEICDGGTTTLHAVEEYDSYAWYRDNVLLEGETAQTLEVTQVGVYQVEYTEDDCTVSDSVQVVLAPDPEVTNAADSFCDNDGDGMQEVMLDSYFADMIADADSYNITVHESQEDADADQNSLDDNIYTIGTGTTQLFVRFEYNTSCYVTAVIDLVLEDQLVLTPFTLEECMPDTTDQLNLEDYQSQIVSGEGYTFSYFSSMEDAENGENAISPIVSREIGTTVYYVHVVSGPESSCAGITTLSFTYHEYPELNEVMYEYCHTGEGMQVDLNDYSTDISSDTSLSYEFYATMEDAENQTNAISNIYPLSVGEFVVYAEASNGSCSSITTISITIIDQPELMEVAHNYCDTGDAMEFNLDDYSSEISSDTSLSYTYFNSMEDAENNTNAISNIFNSVIGENIIYVRAENDNGCSAITQISLTIYEQPALTAVMHEYCMSEIQNPMDLNQFALEFSDDTSLSYSFFNSMSDAENNTGALSNMYNVMVGNQVIYVRAESGEGCFAIATLTLDIYEGPALTAVLIESCASEFSESFDLTSVQSQHAADNSLTYSYFTSQEDADNNTSAIDEATAMDYPVSDNTVVYVRAENTQMCYNTTTITFNLYATPVVTATVDEQSVEITASGANAPYQYSLDGVNFSSNNTFNNLEPATYTAYVQSADGCIGMITFTIEITDIDYIPTVITPNGDGINDTWVINGIQYFEGSTVKLFDRYGKLIVDTKTTNSPEVWDATYLDEKLPSTTYWYLINLSDGRVFKGYLLIKNRYKK